MPANADLVLYSAKLRPKNDTASVGGGIDDSGASLGPGVRPVFTQLAAQDDLEILSDDTLDTRVVNFETRRPDGAISTGSKALAGTTPVFVDTIGDATLHENNRVLEILAATTHATATIAAPAPALANHVPCVLAQCAEEQVIGVATRWGVTAVQDAQVGGNWAVVALPGDTMREFHTLAPTRPADPAVAELYVVTLEGSALFRFAHADFGPQPELNRESVPRPLRADARHGHPDRVGPCLSLAERRQDRVRHRVSVDRLCNQSAGTGAHSCQGTVVTPARQQELEKLGRALQLLAEGGTHDERCLWWHAYRDGTLVEGHTFCTCGLHAVQIMRRLMLMLAKGQG